MISGFQFQLLVLGAGSVRVLQGVNLKTNANCFRAFLCWECFFGWFRKICLPPVATKRKDPQILRYLARPIWLGEAWFGDAKFETPEILLANGSNVGWAPAPPVELQANNGKHLKIIQWILCYGKITSSNSERNLLKLLLIFCVSSGHLHILMTFHPWSWTMPMEIPESLSFLGVVAGWSKSWDTKTQVRDLFGMVLDSWIKACLAWLSRPHLTLRWKTLCGAKNF